MISRPGVAVGGLHGWVFLLSVQSGPQRSAWRDFGGDWATAFCKL
jgi:hypothetical protein